jgi:hypothetical protein
MVLVNQDLAAQGSTATCQRKDVRAAIELLRNPVMGRIATQQDQFVVTAPD